MGWWSKLFSRKKPSQDSGETSDLFYETETPDTIPERPMSDMIDPDMMDPNVQILDEQGRPQHGPMVVGNPNVPAGLPGLQQPVRRQAPVQATRRNAQQAPQHQPQQIPAGYQPANNMVAPQPQYQQPQYQQPQYEQQPQYQQPVQQPQPQPQQRQQLPIMPSYEIYTDKSEHAFHLYLDLPGVDENAFDIWYAEERNVITVTGMRESILDVVKLFVSIAIRAFK